MSQAPSVRNIGMAIAAIIIGIVGGIAFATLLELIKILKIKPSPAVSYCPQCRSPLLEEATGYNCLNCGRLEFKKKT